MVIPGLRHHLQRHCYAYGHGDAGGRQLQAFAQLVFAFPLGGEGFLTGCRFFFAAEFADCGCGRSLGVFGSGHTREHRLQEGGDGGYAHAHPDGESVERPGEGVVTLARLARCLVEVEHDGYTGHEEQEEYHPELLDAALGCVAVGLERLPQQAENA